MKCLFKKHQFKRSSEHEVGGIIGRHVICKNCHLEYAFLWHIEKNTRTSHKCIRLKIN